MAAVCVCVGARGLFLCQSCLCVCVYRYVCGPCVSSFLLGFDALWLF